MNTCTQEWFHHISEPEQFYSSGRNGREKYKQVARILKYLRDELNEADPILAKPTNSMIDHLVFNCPAPLFDKGDWQTIIHHVLEFLLKASDNISQRTRHFTRQDGVSPLFPNNDLFDEHDVFCFCRALLDYLEQEL